MHENQDRRHSESVAPQLRYDGACPFCERQARRLARLSGGRLRLEAAAGLRAVELRLAERTLRGAAAVCAALALRPLLRWVWPVYRLPGVGPALEALYRLAARHRPRT